MELDGRYVLDLNNRYSCLLFDLDDTLYPLSLGIATACRDNIRDYMIERLGIDETKVPDLCFLLYKHYGTTMAGLRAIGYEFDYDDYHRFVHGRLPYDSLKRDPVLRTLLQSLPIRKVSTLLDLHDGIICFETVNPPASPSPSYDPINPANIFDIVEHLSRPDSGADHLPETPILCKPSEDAMEQALKIAGINPRTAMFFDDSARNILAGKRIGLHTVLIGSSHRSAGADHALESIHNIREALPELWEGAERAEDVVHPAKVAIETTVRA
ncbi:unnamed protein product [Spirodela intermedia]|uniref:Uncharacterized protein n=2 Tax=Spirodela intermedia TaxID=51605 RepID=A0A7I8K5C5_SPIIN|nr:unnamed protein product [Spirodela intermedia]CAA6656805.1 unnamed protein product [Spirodela intermedia]CAA7392747.1 unnamed protein product [Spirodela intermedia]